jgi:hypothetical protein
MKGFLAAFTKHYTTIPVPPEKLPDVALLKHTCKEWRRV